MRYLVENKCRANIYVGKVFIGAGCIAEVIDPDIHYLHFLEQRGDIKFEAKAEEVETKKEEVIKKEEPKRKRSYADTI